MRAADLIASHKAASHPRSWPELAKPLDAGLDRATAGKAFIEGEQ